MIRETISHYRILANIGAGGMGVVYKAEDVRLGRLVALKMLPDNLLESATAIERFKREARAASALNHPNICTIHEIDEFEGKPFIVMELLDGKTLHDSLPLDPALRLDLAIEFADALAAAHEAGIIHRDLKPSNLFITTLGHLKILDFGLAKLTAHDDSSQAPTAYHDLTKTDTTLGTVAYMSPEQARGEPLDRRTDLFSFGAVLYEMVIGRRAFQGTTAAMIFDAVLHRDPPPASGEFGPIIEKALQKDRELRYQSAADIRADLKRLKRESGSSVVAKPKRNVSWAVGAAIGVAIVAGAGIVWRTHPAARSGAKQTTIAVLPFANLGASSNRDYLRVALPDELITVLSHSRSLAVRPFAATQKFSGDVDPQQVGRNLKVSSVVTGHFSDIGGTLGITVEAIDVEKNDVLWRDSFDVAAQDLIAMRNTLSERVRAGLLPSLHVETQGETNHPTNDEAYSLFMRAAGIPGDPGPNKEAISMLRRAVELDRAYAPAWAALAKREYYDSEYGDGGDPARARAVDAARRAVVLDPDFIDPAGRLITMDVEAGRTTDAYRQARDLLRRRPESAIAHFTLAYVLRYAGLLHEAARECDAARSIDPNNPSWRSCALVFAQLGDLARAREYMDLDRGSEWAQSSALDLMIGKLPPQILIQKAIAGPDLHGRSLLRAVLDNRSPSEIDSLAKEAKESVLRAADPESAYFDARWFILIKRTSDALDLLRTLAPRNYCVVTALDRDPAFDPIRKTPEFQQIRNDAVQCQQRFLQWRAANAP